MTILSTPYQMILWNRYANDCDTLVIVDSILCLCVIRKND